MRLACSLELLNGFDLQFVIEQPGPPRTQLRNFHQRRQFWWKFLLQSKQPLAGSRTKNLLNLFGGALSDMWQVRQISSVLDHVFQPPRDAPHCESRVTIRADAKHVALAQFEQIGDFVKQVGNLCIFHGPDPLLKTL
jgi:hypothetical protein